MNKFTAGGFPLVLMLLGVCLVGCGGGGKATVEGVVTLDGKALAGVDVTFEPTFEGGLPAYGLTDSDGHYELKMSMSKSGAMAGEHIVRISAMDAADSDSGDTDEGATAKSSAAIPAKYNEDSELKATVKSGANTIDFALES